MQAPNILESLRSLFARIHVPTSGALTYTHKMFWAGALGCLFWPQPELGEDGSSVTITAAAVLACMALPLSLAEFAWDSLPITASRLGLYGLNVAGEVLFLAVLIETAVGLPEVQAWHLGLAAGLAILCSAYSLRILSFSHLENILAQAKEAEDNTPEDVGSK